MHSNKKSEEEVLNERAVKTTLQIIYDKRLFEKYDNADEVLKKYLLSERRRPSLEKLNDDDVNQWFYL